MARVLFTSFFAAGTLAHVTKRFSVGDQASGTVDPGVAADCTYWVNVQSGDTCASIESYFGLTQAQLVGYNHSLKSDCSGLTVGHSYCVEQNYGRGPPPTTTTTSTSTVVTSPSPTNTLPSPTQSGLASNCNNYYDVQPGNTCQGIVDQYGTFALSSFYSWNPAVGNNCQGLQAGYYVCVGVPGTPTSKPTSTSPSISGPEPEQTGIVSGCNNYYFVQSGDSCQGIVNNYGTFTLQQFYSWNPAVGSSCQSLQAGYYVCVGVKGTPTTKPTTTPSPTPTGPSPTQSGIVSDCTKYYQAVSGDSCSGIASKFGTFTLAQFEQWNPAVGSSCSGLFAGYYYCIAVPGTPTTPISTATPSPTHGPQPQEPNTASNCNRYHDVVSGDTCEVIEQQYGISAADFQRWNPNIGSDCKNLWLGYYVCVGV